MRRQAVLLTAILMLASMLAVSGCGDDESTGSESGQEAEVGEQALGGEEGEAGLSEEEREEAERAQAEGEIPEADRVAYYNIATATGVLRIRAAAEIRGKTVPPLAEIRAASQRVDALAPENELLARLQDRLGGDLALSRAITRGDARDLIREANAVERGLRRYAHQEPLIHVFVPD